MTDFLNRILDLSPEKRALLIKKLKERGQTFMPPANTFVSQAEVQQYDNYQVQIGIPGRFDSFVFQETTLPTPGLGQLTIRVKAYGLNFRDLMIAMNLYPPTPGVPSVMGSDVAGVVINCGEDVDQFKPGDEVIALTAGCVNSDGSIAENSHFVHITNVFAKQVVLKPNSLSFEEAASLPTVYLTSYYSIVEQARLKKGERILIHTACSGIGQAAIQIAKWCEGEIFTTAGTPEKRAHLKEHGIKFIMDSRSDAYVQKILDYTQNEGVDVVLNTLSGKAVNLGLQLLRPFGRFLQVDKKSIALNEYMQLGSFMNGLSFVAVDLALMVSKQELLQEMLVKLVEHIREGHFGKIPVTIFPLHQLGNAITHLSRAKHIGKLVVSL